MVKWMSKDRVTGIKGWLELAYWVNEFALSCCVLPSERADRLVLQ